MKESAIYPNELQRFLQTVDKELSYLNKVHEFLVSNERAEQSASLQLAGVPSPESQNTLLRYETHLDRRLLMQRESNRRGS